MDNKDCHQMDCNSRSGHYRNHNDHRRARNQSYSSALLAAICKSIEVEGGMVAYKKSDNRQETRNLKTKMNRSVMKISRIERQWDDDPWLNDVKSIRGASAKMVAVFNTEKYEAEAAYITKHREFRLSFQSNMTSIAPCSSECKSDSTSGCPYLFSDTEYLYTHTFSIPTAKTERNFHHLGSEDRACKRASGGNCSCDLHGKSILFRDGNFQSTEKPFNPNTNIKSQIREDSRKSKQPTSPCRKLINFLHSLFMSGGTKKPKPSPSSPVSDSNSYNSSVIKSVSLYSSFSSVQSRPCLSKTSKVYSNNNSESRPKSMAFYPSVIVDNTDFRPCGEKRLSRTEKYPASNPNPANYLQITHPSIDAYRLPPLTKELKHRILDKDSHAIVAAATADENIISECQKQMVIRDLDKEDEEEEDDDDSSCSSADLFELENLTAINVSNVSQKPLPACEPTDLETNIAIAKRLAV